jgi:FG-GAP repeat protein
VVSQRLRTVRALVAPLALVAGLLEAPGAAAARGPAATPARPSAADTSKPDFNGDGYADLAASALYEDVVGVNDAGAVNVLYGTSAGLQTDMPANQFWSQASPDVQGSGPEAGAQFGFCLAFGDFNRDGYSDLAICVSYLDVDGVSDAGAVEVLYGSAAGLQATAPDDQLWSQNSPGVHGEAEAGDAFGRSAAGGDFNGDGFSDLAVEIRQEDVGTAVDAGAVAVLYGGSNGLQADAPDDQFWTQDSQGVDDQAEANDWFGRNLATGDFNADGYADLAAGAFLEDLGSLRDAGGVEILYGSSAGLQSISPADQFWTQDSAGVRDQSEVDDYFGHTVIAGYFNGDEFEDLAISSRLEDIGNDQGVGGVEVLYGTAAGLQADAPEDRFWTQDSASVKNQTRKRDQFGFSLAAGDFNGDGFDDLAIGVPFKGIPPNPNAGMVAVLYGSAALGLQAVSPDDQIWGQDAPGVLDQAEVGDTFGLSLVASDFNADGKADLAVGVDHEGIDAASEAGAVAVFAGSPSGLQADSPDDQLWSQDSPNVLDSSEAGDQLGWWLA